MAAHVLEPLLVRTVTAKQPAADALLRTAMIVGETANTNDLLIALAKHPALPADLRDNTQGDIRAAFLTRGDISDPEREQLLNGETRAVVLSALAAAEDTDPKVLHDLAAHRTRTITHLVLTNTGAPAETRRKAALHLDATWTLTGTYLANVADWVATDHAGINDYAQQLHTPELLTKLYGADGLTGESVTALAARIAEHIAHTTEQRTGWQRDRDVLRHLEAAEQLSQQPNLGETARRTLIDASEQLRGHLPAAAKPRVNRLQTKCDPDANRAWLDQLNEAQTSTDVAALKRLFRESKDPTIRFHIACNRATPTELTVKFATNSDHVTFRKIMDARRGQWPVLVALWQTQHNSSLTWIDGTADDIETVLELVWASSVNTHRRLAVVNHAAEQHHNVDKWLLRVPIDARLPYALQTLHARAVADKIAEAGTPFDPQMFATLAGEFDGTWEELIEATTLLNA